MTTPIKKQKVSELTLSKLFPKTLTDVPCIDIDKEREVWVATEMCAHYLESYVDSITVRDYNNKPIGIVGGYDLLNHIRENPTRDFQFHHKVEEIMFKNVPEVQKDTKLKDLIEKWNDSKRAFAIIPNESKDYSVISARKLLELGIRCKTDLTISSMPKKKIITFKQNDTLREILDLMFENNTRKLLLENSDQFISDRLILGEISRILKFSKDIDHFLDHPINQFKMEYFHKVTDDIKFSKLCETMNKMDHPYVVYKDMVVTPWDVCVSLLTEDINEFEKGELISIAACPHCGKKIK